MPGDLYERLREMRRRRTEAGGVSHTDRDAAPARPDNPAAPTGGETDAAAPVAPAGGSAPPSEGYRDARAPHPLREQATPPAPPGDGWSQRAEGVYRRRTLLTAAPHLREIRSDERSIATGGWAPSHPALRVPPAMPALFLDIETASRTTGAGSVAFLVGVGRLLQREGLVEVVQLFLGELAAEGLLLEALDQEIDRMVGPSGGGLYVTYNGASFDLPVLRSRAIMARRRFRELPHLDLLPPTRRLFRAGIGSCSLSRVESLVLGVTRTEDVPSAEVPERYQLYLASGDPEPIRAVCSHHRYDIASLALLAGSLERVLESATRDERLGDDLGVRTPPDRLALARMLLRAGGGSRGALRPAGTDREEDRGRSPQEAARRLLEQERDTTEVARRERGRLARRVGLAGRIASHPGERWVRVREELARVYRRARDATQLVAVLEELGRERGARSDVVALAVVLEHRLRRYDRAHELLQRWLDNHPDDEPVRRRLNRIRRKRTAQRAGEE